MLDWRFSIWVFSREKAQGTQKRMGETACHCRKAIERRFSIGFACPKSESRLEASAPTDGMFSVWPSSSLFSASLARSCGESAGRQ
jgi:hypothetical protein